MLGRPLIDFLPDELAQDMTPDELKEWRTDRHLTQTELGALLGQHKITVYRWEKGERPIPSFLHLALEALAKRGSTTAIGATHS